MEDPWSNNFTFFKTLTLSKGAELSIGITVFILLLIISFLVSCVESAFMTSNAALINKEASEGDKRAIKVKQMLEDPNRFLATIQIINTMIAFINGAISSIIFKNSIDTYLNTANVFNNSLKVFYEILKTVGLTLLTAYFQVIFGELVAKRVGMKWPEKISKNLMSFVKIFYYLFYPLVWVFMSSTTIFARIFGVKKGDEIRQITEEQIKVMVDASAKSGDIQTSEQEIIQNVFEFNDTTVDEVMKHRTEVIAFELNTPQEELFQELKNLTYSRYPIYEESIDNVVGVLHVKDILNHFYSGSKKQFKINKVMRKPTFIFEGKKINELFAEMKKNKVHFAIVVDEYGGTAGIVTMEDLIEEVLGDISDEYDKDDQMFKENKDGSYQVNGLIPLFDLKEKIEIDLPTEDYDTLSGFMIAQYNHIPQNNDVIEFSYNGYIFKSIEILEMVVTKAIIKKEEDSVELA